MCLHVKKTREEYLASRYITVYKVLDYEYANQYGYYQLHTPYMGYPTGPGQTIKSRAYVNGTSANLLTNSGLKRVLAGDVVHAYTSLQAARKCVAMAKKSIIIKIRVPLSDVVAFGYDGHIGLTKLTIPKDIKAHVCK